MLFAQNTDLDVEALLRQITAVHARASMLQLHEQLVSEMSGADLELVYKPSSSSR